MWTTIKQKYKVILTTIGIVLVGIIVAFLFEDYYRQLIRLLFKIFNGDKIQFFGKNFHLFASNKFVLSFGLYLSVTFLFVRHLNLFDRIKNLTISTIIFFIATISISAFESKRLVLECTACNDGIRKLTYNEITYDKYFIISLVISLIFIIILTIKKNN